MKGALLHSTELVQVSPVCVWFSATVTFVQLQVTTTMIEKQACPSQSTIHSSPQSPNPATPTLFSISESESRSVVSDSLRPLGLYTVHGILQVTVLELVTFLFPRASSPPRDQTYISHTAGGFFTSWATREAQEKFSISTTALLWEDYISRTTWHIILRDFFFSLSLISPSSFLPSFIHSCLWLRWVFTAAWAFPSLQQAGVPL